MFFSLLKFSIFPPFFNINTNINIKIPKKFNINIKINILAMQISISISKAIFWKCIFQYQYQNQYFETAVFNIKININMSKILTFQFFSKFCAMSAVSVTVASCYLVIKKMSYVNFAVRGEGS